MKSQRNWTWVLAVACVFGAASIAGAEDKPAAKEEAKPEVKAEAKPAENQMSKEDLQKAKQAEEQQKRVENTKKQVIEAQERLDKLTKELADNKDVDKNIYLTKQVEYQKKLLGLRQQMQTTVEGQNKEQTLAVMKQLDDVQRNWTLQESPQLLIEMERAKLTKILGDNPSPELKAAFDAYSQASDGLQKCRQKKIDLDNEVKDFSTKQEEAKKNLHKLAEEAKKKSKEEKKDTK